MSNYDQHGSVSMNIQEAREFAALGAELSSYQKRQEELEARRLSLREPHLMGGGIEVRSDGTIIQDENPGWVSSGGPVAAPGALAFRSESGRAVAPQDVNGSTLVTVAGLTTPVDAALAAGLVGYDRDGNLVSLIDTPQDAGQQQQQQRDDAKDPTSDVLEAASETEDLVAQVVNSTPGPMLEAIERDYLDTGSVSESLVHDIAAKSGQDPAVLMKTVQALHDEGRAVAHKAFVRAGMIDSPEAFDLIGAWASRAEPALVRQATKAWLDTRNTRLFGELARRFVAAARKR